MRHVLLIMLAVVVTACGPQPEPTVTIDFTSLFDDEPYVTPTPSHPGEINYNSYCAHCHGYNGEGQHPNTVDNTLSLGMETVPAHDATGHTWEHPDELLVQVILEGIDNPLNQYPMSGWGYVLDEQDALDIIDYMRQWWTAEQMAHQAAITERWNTRYDDIPPVN
ncbi:MAG: cytochrome c [Chloroflexota bacterium]